MNNKTFICAHCKEEFEFDWSEEEAIEEKNKNFGDIDIKNCSIVCDDCYEKIMEYKNK